MLEVSLGSIGLVLSDRSRNLRNLFRMNHRQTPDFRPGKAEGLISKGDTHLRVTKGALSNGLVACSSAEIAEGRIVDIHTVKEQVQQHFEEFSRRGFRTLGVANYSYCSRNSKKVLLQKGDFLKRHLKLMVSGE